MLTVAAETASSPVMGFADFPGILGSGSVGAIGILMGRCDVCVQIAVADTSVGAVAAFLFQPNLAASFTQQKTCKLTVCANITIVEAFAAVLTEMEIVIAVLYTDGRRSGNRVCSESGQTIHRLTWQSAIYMRCKEPG